MPSAGNASESSFSLLSASTRTRTLIQPSLGQQGWRLGCQEGGERFVFYATILKFAGNAKASGIQMYQGGCQQYGSKLATSKLPYHCIQHIQFLNCIVRLLTVLATKDWAKAYLGCPVFWVQAIYSFVCSWSPFFCFVLCKYYNGRFARIAFMERAR